MDRRVRMRVEQGVGTTGTCAWRQAEKQKRNHPNHSCICVYGEGMGCKDSYHFSRSILVLWGLLLCQVSGTTHCSFPARLGCL